MSSSNCGFLIINTCCYMQSILVPGGLGFVGSHTVLEIFQNTDFKIIILDDMSNCQENTLQRIHKILLDNNTQQEINARIHFVQGSVLDLATVFPVFEAQVKLGAPISTIIHFAAKKCVPESTQFPILYYENNFVGSLNLFKCMEKFPQCTRFIFSSTATVYGEKNDCEEVDRTNPLHPYAESKICVEMLMKSLANAHKDWKLITLRYFNPCSSHPSGIIGD